MNNPLLVFIGYAITLGVFQKLIPILFAVIFLLIIFIFLKKEKIKFTIED